MSDQPISLPSSVGRLWARRVGGFIFTVVELCALGGLLGAILFPLVGRLGGAHQTFPELVVLGARSGSFFFLVWAPGAALVREFMRSARSGSQSR